MLVSAIIPYYNDAKHLESCVNSVLSQSYINIEIIIIDDENSIYSQKLLNQILKKSKKIRLLKTKKNKGVSYARNLGIKNSKGALIALIDSDDTWKKNKIKIQIQEMNKKNLDVCYTNYNAKNSYNKIIYKVSSPKKINYFNLIKECPLCCSSILIKSSILKKYKFSKLKTKEDYELWIRLSKKKYVFGGVNQYLTDYKLRNDSLSSNHLTKIYSAFNIYYSYNNFSLITSVFFTLRLYLNAFKKKFF